MDWHCISLPHKEFWPAVVGLLLFYAIAIVFQLYHGGDVMYEMRRRKGKSTLYQLKGSLTSTPYRHGIRVTGLWWHCKSYTVAAWIAAQLDVMAVTGIHTPCPQGHLHSTLFWAISPTSATGSMIRYPTQSHYPDTELTSHCPKIVMPDTGLGRDDNRF